MFVDFGFENYTLIDNDRVLIFTLLCSPFLLRKKLKKTGLYYPLSGLK